MGCGALLTHCFSRRGAYFAPAPVLPPRKHPWCRLENVVQAGAVFWAYTLSVGAGLYDKIKLAPAVIQTCTAHGTDLRQPRGRPAPSGGRGRRTGQALPGACPPPDEGRGRGPLAGRSRSGRTRQWEGPEGAKRPESPGSACSGLRRGRWGRRRDGTGMERERSKKKAGPGRGLPSKPVCISVR